MPAAGQVIGERYRLERQLDSGGMGDVWVAVHVELDSPVAIKFQRGATRSPTADSRFRREARAAALLRSPHVVHIYDYGFDGDVAFIAMELLTGESVAARLDAGWPVSLRQASTVVRHASRALDLAHARGIIHRDIKPRNLFICREAQGEVIKLLDFGIAKWIDRSSVGSVITDAKMVVGSVAYMSPEQARAEPVDHRSDVWSLGVVAYQLVTGISPFAGKTMTDILNRISGGEWELPSALLGPAYAGLDGVFTRALQRERDERFQSAGDFSGALMQIIEQMPAEVLDAVRARGARPAGRDDTTRTIR